MSLPQFIRENLDLVIGEWETFALTLLPAAQQMSSLALREHAPSILLAIAADVQTSQSTEQSRGRLRKDNGNAALSISNEDQSIPQDSLGRILEPLLRLAQTSTRSGCREETHFGLGLCMVREIVTAHAGTVWVESLKGLTAFNILIPHHAASARAKPTSIH